MVTLPITFDPCSFLSVANANCFVGTCDSSVSCNVEIDRMDDDDDSREEAPPPLRRRRDLDAWASEFMVVCIVSRPHALDYLWIFANEKWAVGSRLEVEKDFVASEKKILLL